MGKISLIIISLIGFNESLSIKQEGDVPDNLTEITIQPMSEKVEIHIDDSVDIKKQKVKIETESEKNVSVSIVTTKVIENEALINNFIRADSEKVKVIIENEVKSPSIKPIINTPTNIFINQNPTSEKSKGLSTGIIIGIVVGVVVIVVVILVAIVLKKKKPINLSKLMRSNKNNESSDSIGI